MEQKHFFNKKNLIVLAAVIVLIAAAAVVALTQRKDLAPVTEDTRAFLVITVAGEMYEPIELLDEDATYSITRGEMVNVIHVTKDSVTMHSSTCDNQDCVQQGTVNLQNRNDRVLQNMIICMPNEVVLELYTDTEVTELLLNMAGYTTEDAADE